MICEVAQTHDTETDYPNQAQVFDVQTGKPVSRKFPTPHGNAVAWSPDGKRFVYMAYAYKDTWKDVKTIHHNAFMLAESTGEKDDDWPEKWVANRIGGEYIHSLSTCDDLPPTDVPVFANGSEVGEWSASGDAYYTSAEFPSGQTHYNRIGIILLSDPQRLVFLTPEGMDARFPALAPSGDSFVFLGRSLSAKPCASEKKESCESRVQIYRYDSRKPGGRLIPIFHFPDSRLVFDLHWRSQTEVPIKQQP